MADGRLNAWRGLFRLALAIINAANADQPARLPWSFGGGTVLMLQYRHRVSRDIDIFLADPQWLGHLSPRLNDRAAAVTSDYVEQANVVKLILAKGEIDFIAAPALTDRPTRRRNLQGRRVLVEQPAEIIAKKVFHRAAAFKARDFFDLAVVIKRDRKALVAANAILREGRPALIERITQFSPELRQDFAALERLDDTCGFAETVEAVSDYLQTLGS